MKLHVIGAGGVGFWLTVGMSRSNLPLDDIIVYDDDNLEGGKGHGRLPAASPTTMKVNLLSGFLGINFGKTVTVVPKRFTGKESAKGDLVVDCSDMPDATRKRLYNAVLKNSARYIRVSYDGANSTVVVSEGLPLSGENPAEGYSAVPSLALSLVAGGIGAEVLSKADLSQHIEFMISLSEHVKFVEQQAAAA